MTGIGASQKEKDLGRLLYRICGSGCSFVQQQQLERRTLKIYSKRQNLIQNKKRRPEPRKPTLRIPLLAILVFFIWIFSALRLFDSILQQNEC